MLGTVLLLTVVTIGRAADVCYTRTDNAPFCKKESVTLTVVPPESKEVKLGDKVSIVCTATGVTEPYVYWVKGDGKSAKRLGPMSIGTSILYFEEVEADDIDNYKCMAQTCTSTKTIVADVAITVPDKPDCSATYGEGFVIYGVNWVYRNYSAAVAHCESYGMSIAMPKSEKENNRLLDDVAISFNRHPNARKFAHDNWLWIGGNDNDVDGTYVDTTTGEPLTYFNWSAKQPDNWDGCGENESEDCKNMHPDGQDVLAFGRASGTWDDSFEDHERPYVCHCNK